MHFERANLVLVTVVTTTGVRIRRVLYPAPGAEPRGDLIALDPDAELRFGVDLYAAGGTRTAYVLGVAPDAPRPSTPTPLYRSIVIAGHGSTAAITSFFSCPGPTLKSLGLK